MPTGAHARYQDWYGSGRGRASGRDLADVVVRDLVALKIEAPEEDRRRAGAACAACGRVESEELGDGREFGRRRAALGLGWEAQQDDDMRVLRRPARGLGGRRSSPRRGAGAGAGRGSGVPAA